jgi:hypothetical protein
MSVADDLKAELQATVDKMTPEERIRMALALGERDVALFAATQGIDLVTARRLLAKQRQVGRTYSRCASGE